MVVLKTPSPLQNADIVTPSGSVFAADLSLVLRPGRGLMITGQTLGSLLSLRTFSL
jgi:hypothetical protein